MKKWLPLAAAALVSIFAACSDEGTAKNTTPWMSDGKDSIASRDPQTTTRDPEAANEVSKALGHGGAVALGKQDWAVARAQVFVLPSASGSNRDRSGLEGKVDRVEWFKELAGLLPPPPSGPGG